jgi:hypothetical protein
VTPPSDFTCDFGRYSDDALVSQYQMRLRHRGAFESSRKLVPYINRQIQAIEEECERRGIAV